MSEYFMLNCLDLQSRFHDAPGDSSSHIAEKVMRSLNECLGDGRSVKVPTASLLDQHDKLKLTQLNRDELQRLQEEAEVEIAKKCALEIKSRFDGKGCMGTSIHATVPFYESSKKFFFDEEFMLKCANANSATILEYGSLLIPIIMSKMPSDVRLQIARSERIVMYISLL
jgi:hypothetical protein